MSVEAGFPPLRKLSIRFSGDIITAYFCADSFFFPCARRKDSTDTVGAAYARNTVKYSSTGTAGHPFSADRPEVKDLLCGLAR